MVRDALEIADQMQQHRRLYAVLLAHRLRGQMHEEGAERILIPVGIVLTLADRGGQLRREVQHGLQALMQRQLRVGGHALGQLLALDERDGRRGEQTLVQHGGGIGVIRLRDQPVRQLFQQPTARQQHQRAQHIEDRVDDRDLERVDRLVDEGEVQQQICRLKYRQPDDRADDIEAQMHDGGPVGIFIRADGRKHGRHAGADVLAHDDGDRRAIADRAGRRERLQDTDRGGRGLHDAGQNRTGQHTENGIGEHQEELCEVRVVAQARDRAGQ